MRRPSFHLPILLGSAATLALVSASLAQAPQGDFAVSFTAGARDDAGRFMGGTEMRVLAAHGGRLYAGNGYWEDQPGPDRRQRCTPVSTGVVAARSELGPDRDRASLQPRRRDRH